MFPFPNVSGSCEPASYALKPGKVLKFTISKETDGFYYRLYSDLYLKPGRNQKAKIKPMGIGDRFFTQDVSDPIGPFQTLKGCRISIAAMRRKDRSE